MARMMTGPDWEWSSTVVCRGCEKPYLVDQDDVNRFEGRAERHFARCPGCNIWQNLDRGLLPYWVRQKADAAFAEASRRV